MNIIETLENTMPSFNEAKLNFMTECDLTLDEANNYVSNNCFPWNLGYKDGVWSLGTKTFDFEQFLQLMLDVDIYKKNLVRKDFLSYLLSKDEYFTCSIREKALKESDGDFEKALDICRNIKPILFRANTSEHEFLINNLMKGIVE